MPADELEPTLLAGDPLADASRSSIVLVGATFLSEATTAAEVIVRGSSDGPNGVSSQVALTAAAQAGTALLERVVAIPSSVPGAILLTVSGPADGVVAEVYDPDGSVIARVPPTDRAGAAPVPSTPDDVSVRSSTPRVRSWPRAPLTDPVGR